MVNRIVCICVRELCVCVCCESVGRNVVICVFFVSHFKLMKACVSRVLGVTIKEISVSTVPQVLLSPIQLVMGGV